ncbi:hypothetical protein RFI_33538 [Reticulomyxa filosa]|uniref:Uncharacterized protein n=1 Tax=Reticulomyxa filosa TaxID=46433 RepID=X6LT38_RETFI|nr:hypothetical protein RFI_33538 [Reticulomyxa filosa]|eukprot:ETO03865.1 hypothetical protein RFI_33538 [Reticulomyxa filosa]
MKIELKLLFYEDFCIVELLLLINVMHKYFTKCKHLSSISKCFLRSVFPFVNKSSSIFFILHHQRLFQEKTKKIYKNELKLINQKEEIQIIIHHWIRILNIKLGWIKDFDKFVVNYVSPFVLFF